MRSTSTQVRDLGEGSFASVEECVLNGQHVAVKRLRPELFRDLDEIKGFVAEGITLAELEHRCGSRCAHWSTTCSNPRCCSAAFAESTACSPALLIRSPSCALVSSSHAG